MSATNSHARHRRFVPVLVIVMAWQAAASLGLVGPRVLASPVRVAESLWRLTVTGVLPVDMLVSAGRVLAGLSIAIVLGGGCALLAGLSRLGEDSVDAPLQMLRTLPHLALVPLLILWFGIGEMPKVALIAIGCVFPIYLNLLAGIRGIDPRLIEMARTLGLDRRATIRHVILPGALPSALIGLRYAVGVGWLSLVVAEQINAQSGIGFLIMDARDFLRTDVIMVGLATYAVLGLLTDAGVRAIERRALAWRPVLAPP